MKDTLKSKIIKWLWILFLGSIAALAMLLLLVGLFADIPSFESLEHPDNKLATQVIAEGGEVLCTFHVENRSYVTYQELSPYLVQAAVATEDVRFYQHSGIDFRSLGRVLVKTLIGRNSSQGGGSTITQQLAKTLYPREEVTSRIPGARKMHMVKIKLKEWITAVKLERNYTKDEIITMYLNSVFFGSNAYGIRAAAQTFFSKHPSELTLEESATLVGMVNKPTRYNPIINPDKSKSRRDLVISRMAKAKYIDRHSADSLKELPLETHFQEMDHNSGRAPYFRDMLYRVMSAKKPSKKDYSSKVFESDSLRQAAFYEYKADSARWRDDPLYGWLEKNRKPDGTMYNLYTDGLRIYTTINFKMQRYAEEAVVEHLGKDLQKEFEKELKNRANAPFSADVPARTREISMKQARRWSDRYRMMKRSGASESEILKSFDVPVKMRVFAWNKEGYKVVEMTPNDSILYYKSFLRAAFMAIEPHTGYVKAYVGGPNYRYFKYDNVTQAKRQVGSTIKPFLYTDAISRGEKTPCSLMPNMPASFGPWSPRGTGGSDEKVSLKWGLTVSSNFVSSQLMKELGPDGMVEVMRRMGITSYVDHVPSLCVGTADISVCEMVAAYNTFPSEGIYIAPMFVTRIEDSTGNQLGKEMFVARKNEAISVQQAYTMIDMMQGVVESGTATRLRYKYALACDIAGKTGTTNNNSDAWFIGYTPNITAGAWVGGEDRNIHFQNGAIGQGSSAALPIVGLFLKKVTSDGSLGVTQNDKFVIPTGVHIPCEHDGESQGSEGSEEVPEFFDN
ncbi:MAG: transglycosylase domain-containing protein [Bacteroidales bacterium]|nr:transglycosylase domain-containing protein [Bacteroidales bacterium]